MGGMERIGVRELNRHTSRVIEQVKRGHVIEVTERGKLVARMVPVPLAQSLLDRLVGEGRAVAPTVSGPPPMPPVIGDPATDAAAVLARARDEERR
jgi:prevent-host-death family protein